MRLPAVPLAALGAIAFLVAGEGGDPVVIARLVVCGAALGAVAAMDVTEHRIPNRLVLPAAGVCAALSIAHGPGGGLLTGLVVVALLLLVSLAHPAALGMGGVKLVLLVVLGLDGDAARALIVGLLLAALVGLALLARFGRAAGRRALPLAPFLAVGSLVAVLA
jgi:leader peptidase (prepilin peptidase)/N-methyltransferase